jgi:hypothetical protein
MEAKDWLLIASTVLGPILAVQAQKWVEVFRERRSRKLGVFQTLMATRAARVSGDHVKALNMIDLVFYGSRPFGMANRSKSEQRVLDAWHEYHNHLNIKANDAAIPVWVANGEELFTNLLFAIAEDLSYSFDRVQLKTGSYSPVVHGDIEADQTTIRKLLVKLLAGERALKMDVEKFPIDPEALKTQIGLQKALGTALTGDGALNVHVQKDNTPS